MSPSSPIAVACLGLVLASAVAGCSSAGAPVGDAAIVVSDGGGASDLVLPGAGDAFAAGAAPATRGDAPAASPGGPCQSDGDCQLVDDCCSCQAISPGEKAPSCDPNRLCGTTVCAQFPGVDRAHCSAGRCVLGFDCDSSMIACKRLPPLCPPGQIPQVVGQGDGRCYGECVEARQCLTVPACSACRPTDLCARPDASTALHCLGPAATVFQER
jgi:hypothetical protein